MYSVCMYVYIYIYIYTVCIYTLIYVARLIKSINPANF